MTSHDDPRYLGELESPTILDEDHETEQVSTAVTQAEIHRHSDYYFDDGNLVILVSCSL